ncbi:hypothetical protein ABPG72_021457 [Tetrahymena utriculariae]
MINIQLKTSKVKESLFDDLDQNIRESYKMWSKNIPLIPKKTDQRSIEGTLFRKSIKKGYWKSNTYQLIGNKLIKFTPESGKPEKFVNIENYRLDKIKLEEKGDKDIKYGFRLTHNCKFMELYARNKEHMLMWFELLKRQCVLTTFQNDYSTIKLMGKGNFARVYYARSKLTGGEFAVKAFEKDKFAQIEIDRPALIKEISILRKMNHPGVIKMYEVYENETHIFLVNELLKGGELFHKLKGHGQFDEVYVAQLMTTLLDSIHYISQRNILHRDIKPENLILRSKNDDTDLCLADFGLADYYDPNGGYMFQRCGTPGYVAPEVLADKIYDFKVDTFSAGVIMFILLTGSSPFKGKSYDEIVIKNYNCTIDFNYKEMSKYLSVECFDLLQKLLKKDPQERYSAIQALNHPWFTKMKVATPSIQQKSSVISSQTSLEGDQIVRIAPKDNLQLKSKTPLMNSKWSEPQEQQSPETWKKQQQQQQGGRNSISEYVDSPMSRQAQIDSPQIKTPGGSQYSQPFKKAPDSNGSTKPKQETPIIKMQSVPECVDEYDIDPSCLEDTHSPLIENMKNLQKYDLNNKNSKKFKEVYQSPIIKNPQNLFSNGNQQQGKQVNNQSQNLNVSSNSNQDVKNTKTIREKLIQNV